MKLRFFLLCLFSFFAAAAQAANLTVMPTSLRIAPPKALDVITIRNEGRAPVKMQIRIFRWEQKGGKDVYYPATGLVVISPPMLTIKGGADGNIKVARDPAAPPVRGIESYRLIIDELPSSRVRARVTGQAAAVEVVTRQILPVFFTGAPSGGQSGGAGVNHALSFRAAAVKGGYMVSAANHSAAVVRISSAALLAGGQEVGRSRQTVGNILPKSEIKFFVPGKGGGKPQEIRIAGGKGVDGIYPIR